MTLPGIQTNNPSLLAEAPAIKEVATTVVALRGSYAPPLPPFVTSEREHQSGHSRRRPDNATSSWREPRAPTVTQVFVGMACIAYATSC